MVVAGGVAAVLDVIVVILGLLGNAAGEIALALLGDDVGNITALCLEVVLHYAGLILAAIVLEHRFASQFADAVKDTDGLDLAAVHVHADLGRTHVDIAILDLAATIHHRMVTAKEDNAVLGIKLDNMIKIHAFAYKSARVPAFSG